MKITVTVSIGLVGCKKTSVIEVEDGSDDEAIEESAKDEMFNMIEWGWRRADEDEVDDGR